MAFTSLIQAKGPSESLSATNLSSESMKISKSNFALFPKCEIREAIVTWIKKKTGPGISNVTTVDDAERILTSESKLVLGFLNSLVVCFLPSGLLFLSPVLFF